MGRTAHITAHFCGIPATPWDNPWQQVVADREHQCNGAGEPNLDGMPPPAGRVGELPVAPPLPGGHVYHQRHVMGRCELRSIS